VSYGFLSYGKFRSVTFYNKCFADNRTASKTLHELEVKVVNLKECQKESRKAKRNKRIENTKICAGASAGKSPCAQDRGGPLVMQMVGTRKSLRWIHKNRFKEIVRR